MPSIKIKDKNKVEYLIKKLCNGEMLFISDFEGGLFPVRDIKFLHKGEDSAIFDCWAVYIDSENSSLWYNFDACNFYLTQRLVFI
jgi:hypothetical protein